MKQLNHNSFHSSPYHRSENSRVLHHFVGRCGNQSLRTTGDVFGCPWLKRAHTLTDRQILERVRGSVSVFKLQGRPFVFLSQGWQRVFVYACVCVCCEAGGFCRCLKSKAEDSAHYAQLSLTESRRTESICVTL